MQLQLHTTACNKWYDRFGLLLWWSHECRCLAVQAIFIESNNVECFTEFHKYFMSRNASNRVSRSMHRCTKPCLAASSGYGTIAHFSTDQCNTEIESFAWIFYDGISSTRGGNARFTFDATLDYVSSVCCISILLRHWRTIEKMGNSRRMKMR